ncbi:LOW QUALITY PROTEIN: reverse transcriptase [Phytophthora megakarya]|uniref:Reverse transcriptase n=1 Tax=Phytophthora megakarya TaxID=4795 RepID=A0A225VAX3_9STRA|nr:LOW QUALITY PROTEIN: reverse transcriptase [Phytophthora megakarya]
MAVLPEVPVATEDVKIEHIQLCGSDNQTPGEIERLRQKIWKFRHLLIGKGNALPPAARGIVCDIDVGGARPIAFQCRKLRIQFREKLADLIKGLLSAKIYQRMIDNALYGFTRIPKSEDHGSMADVFEDGEPADPGSPSVLGRRSYIDDILIPANKREATVVVYASDWAISGALMQEYDQIYYPVTFASRTLKSNELNYGITEKEVLALLRILDLNYNTLVGRPIRVLTRHSTLAWLFRSTALQGRLGQWAALLSPWTLEFTKCVKGEDEILGALAASITPRSEVDKALISIAPKKEPRRKIQAPIPTIRREEDLYVFRLARAKRGGGAYSAILWKLPEWRVLKARSGYAEVLTVNEAEYHGLLLYLDLLEDLDPQRLVICGGSNLVIQQVRGEIDCKAPGLTLLRQRALDRLCT